MQRIQILSARLAKLKIRKRSNVAEITSDWYEWVELN